MTSDSKGISETGGRVPVSFDAGIIIVVLVATLSQYSIGAVFDKTGEQVSGGLPLTTLILALGVLAVLVKRRKLLLPVPSWVHIAFLCAASLGMLGLSRWEMKSGIKEIIQIAEVFGLSWYLFASCSKPSAEGIVKGMGIIGIIIIVLGIGRVYEIQPFMLSEARWAGLQLVSVPFVVYAFREKTKVLLVLFVLIAAVNGLFLKNGGMLLGLAVVLSVSTWSLMRSKLWLAVSASIVMVVLACIAFDGRNAWDTLNPHFDETYKKRLFVEYQASLKSPLYYPAGGGVGHYKQTINVVKQYLDDEVSPLENKIPRDSNSQYLLTLVESGWPAGIALFGLLAVIGLSNVSAKNERVPLLAAIGMAAVGLLIAGIFTTTLGRGIGIWLGGILGLATVLKPGSTNDPKEFFTRLSLPIGFFVITSGVMIGFNVGVTNDGHVSRMNQRLRNILPFAVPYKPAQKLPEPTLLVIKANGGSAPPKELSLKVEGEDFVMATGALKKVSANDADGGKALDIPLNSGKGKGRADYTVTLSEPGTYRVRFRVYWEDGCSNSLRFVCADGKQLIASEQFKTWHTLTSRKTFEFPKGDQIVSIENTEDGIKLDYFELVKETSVK